MKATSKKSCFPYNFHNFIIAFFPSIIHIAVINRQVDALKLIIDMVDKLDVGDVLDEPNRIGSSALHLAVETNQPNAVT